MGTYYEFFAGGGMARAGLGPEWTCLFANDICRKKGDSYRANWGDDHLWIGDIFEVQAKQLAAKPDLVWGSFPCQDLSLAGNGKGLSGERSGAFWGFWKIIGRLNRDGRKPRMIVLENVCGTLTSRDGKDFEQIAKAVAAEGYVFGAVVIDAVHFVPQSRPRLFVIGIDASLSIPADTHAELPTPAWHPDAVIRAFNRMPDSEKNSWRWWNLPLPTQRVASLDAIIEVDPQGVEWHPVKYTEKLLDMMSEVNRRKVINAQRSGTLKVGTIYRRTRNRIQRAEVRFDGIAGCLRTPAGGSSRQTIMVVNGPHVRSRLISPREMARLMGLADEYVLPSSYNDAYHLLGDGVVAPVVAHLRTHILGPVMRTNFHVPHLGRRRA